MVNEKTEEPAPHVSESLTRQTLLNILREQSFENSHISGDKLGEILGISRVAVHKHIQGLRQEGYAIEAGRKGYILGKNMPPPFSSREFLPEEHITVIPVTGSTMDASRRLSLLHPQEEFTLAALRQNKGRGRQNKIWESPEGGIWATRVLYPECSTLRTQLYVMAAAAALARVLKNLQIQQVSVKWPNDVLVSGQKIAGILGETLTSGDRISRMALGLGMNVNNPAPSGAVSLKDITGTTENRSSLLREWLAGLDTLLSSKEFKSNSPGWWNSIMHHNGSIWTLRTADGVLGGRCLGTDSLGRLILQPGKKTKHCIPAGEVLEIKSTGENNAG